ncbi:glycoside hydrolase family 3 protein [Cellulosimicrobium funkei]|uniref:glycoside hydrolase family 3 N-terminal domain-containing protein n=1 Tax=Cellulosimicrobium funkei TaxID=264251 RepID=UPI00203D0D01|nr:glycoside hydrolase family 3 N-terminal domain-containing protein [Cellulosimicrobium funkei]MCM3535282.1 glycoside hydrolase family 3 protein [Cellulosimicrobium funkei]
MKTTTTAGHRDNRAGRVKGAAALASLALVAAAGCTAGTTDDESAADAFTTREVTDGTTSFVVVDNPGDGPTLSYGKDSAVELLTEEVDGQELAFKDMNANGMLDTWEDWREPAEERAAALSEELTIEQIAGLMLFSSHERSQADGLTDAQKEYLTDSHLRNVLHAGPSDVEATVTWANEMQAYAESLATADEPYVPVNFASDPRSTAGSGGYNAEGADISRWPSNLGLAATFDVEHMDNFAEMSSAEYRALGITTALSPQIDLATEPRWLRVGGTFGEDVEQNTELAAAYVDGYQSTSGQDGWGPESVNAMIKHWAGDGPGEGGREAHTDAGKYGVYPGGNFDAHTEAFLGSLDSAAVMSAYSIALDGAGEPLFGERVGTAYDDTRMNLLREENGYQGVVVTDWGVTTGMNDEGAVIATGWGAEDLTKEQRHYEILKTGHDMFGGNNDVAPVLAAHEMWQADFEAGTNDVDADTRFRESGARILTMFFNPGLYENAYLDLDESTSILASDDKVDAGYAAQLDSVVLLKNDGETVTAADAEAWKDKTVYIPRSYNTGFASSFGPGEYTEGAGIDLEVAEQYFGTVLTDEAVTDADDKVTSYTAPDLSDVDLVLVGMDSPDNGGTFSNIGHDLENDTWYPLSLQYRPYTADGPNVRQTSISGDLLPDGTRQNRSYFGNTSKIANESDLDAFERAVAAVEASGKDIPVVTVLKATNPVVPAEFEPASDAIVVGFGTSDQALLEVVLGLHEPQGRLPVQLPKDMDTVEAQQEDVAKDMTPYTDAAGNAYDYGFGLSYGGPITD